MLPDNALIPLLPCACVLFYPHVLFDIGNEVIAYSSLDEMCELASYFLAHDKKRREIALNSYEKILHQYNYPTRLDQLLLLAFS